MFQLKPVCQLGLGSHQGSLEEVHLNSTKEIIQSAFPSTPFVLSRLPIQASANSQQHSMERETDKKRHWNYCLLFYAWITPVPWQSSWSQPAAWGKPLNLSPLSSNLSMGMGMPLAYTLRSWILWLINPSVDTWISQWKLRCGMLVRAAPRQSSGWAAVPLQLGRLHDWWMRLTWIILPPHSQPSTLADSCPGAQVHCLAKWYFLFHAPHSFPLRKRISKKERHFAA